MPIIFWIYEMNSAFLVILPGFIGGGILSISNYLSISDWDTFKLFSPQCFGYLEVNLPSDISFIISSSVV